MQIIKGFYILILHTLVNSTPNWYSPIPANGMSMPCLSCLFFIVNFQSDLVCEAVLTFKDNVTGNYTTLDERNLDIGENNITFHADLLEPNRHYNVIVEASNARGLHFSSIADLSE
jgi:hypothetical protein